MQNSPFIVAELSGNHDGSLHKALETVDAVATTGADAIKLQTYTPETITLDVDSEHFRIGKDHQLWGGARLFDLYQKAHTPWEWHHEIFARARAQGLEIFSTPFDFTAVDFLETLDNPIYKIASIEINHLPLIQKAAQTGKPLIISTGTATLSEISDAVDAARTAGATVITLLVCSSSYPADPKDANLARIEVLRKSFGLPVGISDHTLGIGVSIAATALGATVIEKHVTLDKTEQGVDSEFSIDIQQLTQLVEESKRAFDSIGSPNVWVTAQEKESQNLRPSVWVNQDIAQGEELTTNNVRIARPSGGIQPKYFEEILGRTASKNMAYGTPVQWQDLDINRPPHRDKH